MDLGLKGRRVLITGGTRGIGRDCADIFAEEGALVALCARDAPGVTATVNALRDRGATAFGRAVDVANGHALQSWVRDSAASLGGIDIVVGNVSALAVGEDEASWDAGYGVDMMHSVRLVNAAMPWLERSDAASITLVSSVSGRDIDFTGPSYGAFKAALVHYAKGLAVKLAPRGIRANTVSPGNTYFEGGVWAGIERGNPALFAQAMKANPTGRMARPDEIARGIVFLASPASGFTSGTNLVIDGALTTGVQL